MYATSLKNIKAMIYILMVLIGLAMTDLVHGQDITSTGSVILPASSGTTYVVNAGETRIIKSATAITLQAGTHFKSGSDVLLRIENMYTIPVAPSNPNANLDMNWTLSRSFDAKGAVIAEQKSFFDFNGRAIQSQYKDMTKGHVLATEVIYDAAGRASVQTLAAPINNAEFAYKTNFVTNSSNTAYGYKNFDGYLNGTAVVDKTHAPDAIGGKASVGSLGWYYSAYNTWEPYQDITDYPYSRQAYAYDGSGIPTKAAGVGNEFRMGKGHETVSYTVPVKEELTNYWAVRNKFFTEAQLGVLRGVKTSENQAIMSVGVDAGGTASFAISLDGNTLVSGAAGTEVSISKSVAASTSHYFALLQSGTVSFSPANGRVLNLVTGVATNVTTSSLTLASGWYAFENTGTNTTLGFTVGLRDLSYHFYNQLGQLVASVAPEGVKKLLGTGLNSYSSKEAIPFITLYTYDAQGRLQTIKEPDLSGPSEYVYRKDGAIRFSQNALQRADGRFSYSNYDAIGRIIEAGIYKPGTSGIVFNASRTASSTMRNILENTTQDGGLLNGTKYDVVRYTYDVVDNSHGQSNFVQDSYFLRGGISVSEKYSTIVNNVAAAQNLVSKSWYNYNGDDQIDWHIQYINGLGYKTTDYSYDEFGVLTKKVFQRHVAGEFLAHYYEYDDDRRLSAVYTNTVDNPATKMLHARYQYYLHGALKRVELGDDLQGIDYVYTADGKLKSVNNPNPSYDPGGDGMANTFAKDVFGYSLEYHPNDYSRANTNIKNMQSGGTLAQYAGLVNGVVWSTMKPASAGGTRTAVMNTYAYDSNYQLTANNWGTPNFTTANFTTTVNAWQEKGLSYDSHGNIKTLQRSNGSGTLAANYSYNYVSNSNKLASVGNYASYTYDALGQLASETKGTASKYLVYDGTGKVTAIYSDAAKTTAVLSFAYDESGNRIKKQDHLQNITTWYSYDESGGLNGIYNGAQLIEQPIPYGQYYKSGSVYRYQLTDQVGTVRAIINRSKLSNGNADVVYYADYYPFGTVLQSAGVASRYGYQGEYAEKDNETGWNNFYLRNYDPAIGRWLSTDPYGQYYSPYLGMGNNPINKVDPDGGKGVDWYRPLGSTSNADAVWFEGSGNIAGYSRLGDADYTFGNFLIGEAVVNGVRSDSFFSRIFRTPSLGWDGYFQGPRSGDYGPLTSEFPNWTRNHFEVGIGYSLSYGAQVGGGFNNFSEARLNLYSTTYSDVEWTWKKGLQGGGYQPGEKVGFGLGAAYFGGGNYKRELYQSKIENEVTIGILGFGGAIKFDDNFNLTDWFFGYDPSINMQLGAGIEGKFKIGFSK